MRVRLYNTLTNRKEEFFPLDTTGRSVSFYTCGPTVYDHAHIGNFRSFLNADLLRRTLEYCGYDVTHVMNLTDVGHMTEDDEADGSGEDKMEEASRRLRTAKKSGEIPGDMEIDPSDPFAVAGYYIDTFLADGKALGLRVISDAEKHPERLPRPTQYIDQIIAFIKELLGRGHAYVGSDGAVYYDIESFPDYGALSGNRLDAILPGSGGRVEERTQTLKKHPADFLLWKPDQRHLMKWPSPWGDGYPGWHIECSVMALALLGAKGDGIIDLHSGGEDNIFPHHECEIAQSCGLSGNPLFARYWFHTRFLMVEGEKMSKSSNNFHTLHDLRARGASPAGIRLELIRTHYRLNANFTFQGLRDSQRQVERWIRLRDWFASHGDTLLPSTGPGPMVDVEARFQALLADDLNVAGALGVLNKAVACHRPSEEPPAGTPGAATYAQELEALNRMGDVLGVMDLEADPGVAGSDDQERIDLMVSDRWAAREAGDWEKADSLRDVLSEMGIVVKDGPDGSTWSRSIASGIL